MKAQTEVIREVNPPPPVQKPVSDDLFLRTFVQNESALRAYARIMLPDWDAVDDVMQEASVVMWRKLGVLDSLDNFLPWARVIVRFEAMRVRRKHARDRLVFSEELVAMLADEAAEIAVEERLEEAAVLRRCLQKLSPQQQELVLAPYAGDGLVKELSEQAGRSANSLYKLLGRLRAKLQECVDRELKAKSSTT